MSAKDPHIHDFDQRWAFFLDIDGTLSDIAPTPEDACIPPSTLEDLALLRQKTAVALVSGRSIASIDSITYPLIFPAAGQHGLEIRFDDNEIFYTAKDETLIGALAEKIRLFQLNHPGLIVEDKKLSIAVHYRMRPDLAGIVQDFLDRLVRSHERLLCRRRGKMVDEIQLQGANKGTAVEMFMKTPAFLKKIPIFVGDDLTDEDAYRTVNTLGGISIQIGTCSNIAQFCMATPAVLRNWLKKIVTLDETLTLEMVNI